jgi:hypothetical protein
MENPDMTTYRINISDTFYNLFPDIFPNEWLETVRRVHLSDNPSNTDRECAKQIMETVRDELGDLRSRCWHAHLIAA